MWFFCLFFKDFIYLFDRESERAQAGVTVEGEGEAGSPPSREPDAGLDPRPRDHDPSRWQMLNHLSHPGALLR